MALDMTAMHAAHGVLRRELEHLTRLTVTAGDDPRRVMRTATGWRLFTRTLRGHHRAEDDMLWPPLRRSLAGRPDDVVALEALEAEHAALGLLIGAIDTLVADPHADQATLADLTDSLAVGLRGHLAHEEDTAIPLIARVLTPRQWAAFEHVHHSRVGAGLADPAPDRWSSRA